MVPEAALPVGVVGVGALGRHHVRHLSTMTGVALVGVHDADAARAAEVAGEFGVKVFSDLEALLATVEAVTVAVPTAAHAEVGIAALDRGVAVLMEKPLAATLDDADALIAAAARNGMPLQVGHVERFNRAVRAAQPHFEDPRFLESTRLAPFQPRGTDVPVVLDLMIHDLDLILHLTGGALATDVRASGIAVLTPLLDAAHARVEFSSGAVAMVSASRLSRERTRRLRLWQRSGYFSLDLSTGEAEFMRVREGWMPGTGDHLKDVVEMRQLQATDADALVLELTSFIRAARGIAGEPVVTGAQGRAALALALRVAEAVDPSAQFVPE